MARPPAQPLVRTAVVPADWKHFVDRWGVFAAVASLVEILAMTAARLHPTDLGRALAGPQLLLLLIMVGCIAVLSYRSDAA